MATQILFWFRPRAASLLGSPQMRQRLEHLAQTRAGGSHEPRRRPARRRYSRCNRFLVDIQAHVTSDIVFNSLPPVLIEEGQKVRRGADLLPISRSIPCLTGRGLVGGQ